MNGLDPFDERIRLTRRRVLAWAGGLGLATLIPGCADDTVTGTPTPTTSPGTTGPIDCVLTPELAEGPFYLDLDLVRADISEDRPGVPLDLRISVVDADACEPIEGAAVDVWHCDAAGAYSGVEGGEGTFLRGIQMTGSDGVAEFRTIYPGWYSGRAVHIHVKVHQRGRDGSFTGQLFFDERVTAAIYETSPYRLRPEPDTSNAADGIFLQGGSSTLVAIRRGDEGYNGEVRLGLQRG